MAALFCLDLRLSKGTENDEAMNCSENSLLPLLQFHGFAASPFHNPTEATTNPFLGNSSFKAFHQHGCDTQPRLSASTEGDDAQQSSNKPT